MDDLTKKLESFIASVTKRNEAVQTNKKSSSPVSWVVALVLALLSLVGIGVAMWYANRRAKELAAAKTKIEQDKVLLELKEHQAQFDAVMTKRDEAKKEAEHLLIRVKNQEAVLIQQEREHQEQLKRIKALRSWEEINAG